MLTIERPFSYAVVHMKRNVSMSAQPGGVASKLAKPCIRVQSETCCILVQAGPRTSRASELSAGFDPALALSSTLPSHPRQFIMSPVPEGTPAPEQPSTASNPESDNRR